ncbi:hypothetical protein GO003_014720 [Methylicorpusculum oleiharenae]|uniref:hypothetical protein n=1 Tax=Methylicorpusculum oleiharenae TaxID=1338687 RepID=UPI0013588B63|nr:hypothetical protein [Methylicorpusculum oleiharenae]MCD2451646.1 hypothetical protein [Methylicorpusculum oleiharenae]
MSSKLLEGSFFHTFCDDGQVKWQGEFLKEFDDGRYLIQLFSWIDGRPTIQKIITGKETIGMSIYPTAESMDLAWELITKSFDGGLLS